MKERSIDELTSSPKDRLNNFEDITATQKRKDKVRKREVARKS